MLFRFWLFDNLVKDLRYPAEHLVDAVEDEASCRHADLALSLLKKLEQLILIPFNAPLLYHLLMEVEQLCLSPCFLLLFARVAALLLSLLLAQLLLLGNYVFHRLSLLLVLFLF